MDVRMVSCVAVLARQSGVWLIHNYNPEGYYPVNNVGTLQILEIFLQPRTVEEAFDRYQELFGSQDPPFAMSWRKHFNLSEGKFVALIMNQQLYITTVPEFADDIVHNVRRSMNHAYQVMKDQNESHAIDATAWSVEGPPLIDRLINDIDILKIERAPIYNSFEFKKAVEVLYRLGVLRPENGLMDFGNLRRFAAICSDFGWSRGLPVDRYYLDQFISVIRHEVRGQVLEVGGAHNNREAYGFVNAENYMAVDLTLRSQVDRAVDINQRESFADGAFDSIIAFNVLEHCEFPHHVADNFWHWLEPGGKVFCMVPCVQRVHPSPRDYWRPMPDAMKSIFKNFTIEFFTTYGNALTSVAAMMGISAGEMTTDELQAVNTYFPVAICLVARKHKGNGTYFMSTSV